MLLQTTILNGGDSVPSSGKKLLAKNDVHIVQQILYDTGPFQLLEGLTRKLRSFSGHLWVKGPPAPYKWGGGIGVNMNFRKYS